MDGDLVGEELITLAGCAHLPVGDPPYPGVRGMRGLPVRCIAPSFRRRPETRGRRKVCGNLP